MAAGDQSDRPQSGHGGKRPGAGRKKKVRPGTFLDEADVKLLLDGGPPDFVETVAQRHARLAVNALVKKLVAGSNEAARVSAAIEILDRGYGKPAVDVGGDAMLPFMPAATAPAVSAEMRTEARKFARLAIEVLRRIAEFGQSEAASVAAAKSILNRALGTVGMAKVPDDLAGRTLGKREQALEDARTAASGVFETPKPPGETLQ